MLNFAKSEACGTQRDGANKKACNDDIFLDFFFRGPIAMLFLSLCIEIYKLGCDVNRK